MLEKYTGFLPRMMCRRAGHWVRILYLFIKQAFTELLFPAVSALGTGETRGLSHKLCYELEEGQECTVGQHIAKRQEHTRSSEAQTSSDLEEQGR